MSIHLNIAKSIVNAMYQDSSFLDGLFQKSTILPRASATDIFQLSSVDAEEQARMWDQLKTESAQSDSRAIENTESGTCQPNYSTTSTIADDELRSVALFSF